ncbi:hypothetical protein S245_027932, partial [Arachis hypogaea]
QPQPLNSAPDNRTLAFQTVQDSLSKTREKMSRPGDWNCRTCNHLNFQRRESCQRCGEPRGVGAGGDYGGAFGGRGSSSFGFTTGPDVRPGDWRTPPPPDLTPTFLELEAIALPAPLLLALLGNPATGYVLGLDAMSITLQIEWNAIDAMHQGTLLVLGLPIHPRLYLLHLACCGRRELMRSNPYSLLIVVIVFFSSSPSRYISIFASLIFSI